MNALRISIALCVACLPLAGQWLKHPTPGIPRTADGKPDLSAAAPKTPGGQPDLSGMWQLNPGAFGNNIATDVKAGDIEPSAEALYKQRIEDLGKDNPATYQCVPAGPLYAVVAPLARVIQTPALIAILYEDLTYRQIFMDGRELPKDPNPSFMGYSVGRWEGDTLVIESTGFNEKTWLDAGGHPHSESLHLTEKIRRKDFGHLAIEVTLEDPKFYAKPWTVPVEANFVGDTELLEYVCNENEKDHAHLVGKASDDKKNGVKLAPEIVSKYAGSYEASLPENPGFTLVINVTVSGDELFLDLGGKGKQPATALTETHFSFIGGGFYFVMNDQGKVTSMVFQAVEGDLPARRK